MLENSYHSVACNFNANASYAHTNRGLLSSASSVSSSRMSKSLHGHTPKSRAALRKISSIISSLQRVQPDLNGKPLIPTVPSPGQLSTVVPSAMTGHETNDNSLVVDGDDAGMPVPRPPGSIGAGREGRLSSLADSMGTTGSDVSITFQRSPLTTPLGSAILPSTSVVQSDSIPAESALPFASPQIAVVEKRKLSATSTIVTSRREDAMNQNIRSSSDEKLSPIMTMSTSIAGIFYS